MLILCHAVKDVHHLNKYLLLKSVTILLTCFPSTACTYAVSANPATSNSVLQHIVVLPSGACST